MKFKAAKELWSDGLSLLMVDSHAMDGGPYRVVEPVQMTVREVQNGTPMEPTLQLDSVAAQSLMDALWSVGLRPADGKYPQEHVNALRDHLADMRKLVFKSEP